MYICKSGILVQWFRQSVCIYVHMYNTPGVIHVLTWNAWKVYTTTCTRHMCTARTSHNANFITHPIFDALQHNTHTCTQSFSRANSLSLRYVCCMPILICVSESCVYSSLSVYIYINYAECENTYLHTHTRTHAFAACSCNTTIKAKAKTMIQMRLRLLNHVLLHCWFILLHLVV